MKNVRLLLTKSKTTYPPFSILVPLIPKKPLILYLTIHEKSMGCVLGQHDETERKEHAIYYLSKKFTEYESKYPRWKRCIVH